MGIHPGSTPSGLRHRAQVQACPPDAGRTRATKEHEAIVSESRPQTSVSRLLDLVERSLDEDKAENIVSIDLAGKTSIADYMVIANGRSQRQVGAIADHLLQRLKAAGHAGPLRVEGMPQNDWVLIDAGDIVIHIFRPEVRDFYKLEKMWSVDLPQAEQFAIG